MLNTHSGLVGISGLTNDMRVLLEECKLHEDHRVRAAIEVFCYRARKYIGAYLAAMGGADAVVFTGGIGENSPAIREQICTGLEWAGLRLDRQHNQALGGKEGAFTADGSTLTGYVIPTDEELLIARDTVRIILGQPHPA
jgi:acetate kinase